MSLRVSFSVKVNAYAEIVNTLQQCSDLVRVQEETGAPFIFLENCCFGRREMMVLNMVRKGLLEKLSIAAVDITMICGMK